MKITKPGESEFPRERVPSLGQSFSISSPGAAPPISLPTAVGSDPVTAITTYNNDLITLKRDGDPHPERSGGDRRARGAR
ncbi:hypothetical protein FTUN_2767 [Frigoriglobus tundricola]|uniref:Uncharacterized protein n=1 Tax=Frigoriglobus tundricola TaxID=2774151 RepID=A0A6M5YMQ4_9BACT|nr:hypothetical protein FTUN_2767 [Frigoriglobus tundricola]